MANEFFTLLYNFLLLYECLIIPGTSSSWIPYLNLSRQHTCSWYFDLWTVSIFLVSLNACLYNQHLTPTLCVYLVSKLSLCFCPPPVSGLTILNERTAQCQSALGKLQRGRKAKPSMRPSTCLIHTKERALKHKSLLVSIFVLFRFLLWHRTSIHYNGSSFLSIYLRYLFIYFKYCLPVRLCLHSATCFVTKYGCGQVE